MAAPQRSSGVTLKDAHAALSEWDPEERGFDIRVAIPVGVKKSLVLMQPYRLHCSGAFGRVFERDKKFYWPDGEELESKEMQAFAAHQAHDEAKGRGKKTMRHRRPQLVRPVELPSGAMSAAIVREKVAEARASARQPAPQIQAAAPIPRVDGFTPPTARTVVKDPVKDPVKVTPPAAGSTPSAGGFADEVASHADKVQGAAAQVTKPPVPVGGTEKK